MRPTATPAVHPPAVATVTFELRLCCRVPLDHPVTKTTFVELDGKLLRAMFGALNGRRQPLPDWLRVEDYDTSNWRSYGACHGSAPE